LWHVGADQGFPENFCDQLPDQQRQHADDYYRRQCHVLQLSAWNAGGPRLQQVQTSASVLEGRLLWGLRYAFESKTVEPV